MDYEIKNVHYFLKNSDNVDAYSSDIVNEIVMPIIIPEFITVFVYSLLFPCVISGQIQWT